MTVPSATCRLCSVADGSVEVQGGLLYSSELWTVYHKAAPYGVAGWMTLQSRRHVAEPADFSDAEAASFGQVLRRCEQALKQVSGALRIYTAAFAEKTPHFHAHMVPRYAETPAGATGLALFDLARRAAAGEVEVDSTEVARISTAFRDLLV